MKVLAYTSPARGHLYPLVPILDELAGRGPHDRGTHTGLTSADAPGAPMRRGSDRAGD